MGAMIWDFEIRRADQPSKAEEQVEREERARLADAEQDEGENDAPRRDGGSKRC